MCIYLSLYVPIDIDILIHGKRKRKRARPRGRRGITSAHVCNVYGRGRVGEGGNERKRKSGKRVTSEREGDGDMVGKRYEEGGKEREGASRPSGRHTRMYKLKHALRPGGSSLVCYTGISTGGASLYTHRAQRCAHTERGIYKFPLALSFPLAPATGPHVPACIIYRNVSRHDSNVNRYATWNQAREEPAGRSRKVTAATRASAAGESRSLARARARTEKVSAR